MFADHDGYIAEAPEDLRPLLVRMRAQLTHAEDIAAAGLKATKTGVTFSPSQPIPDELVEKLALASRRDRDL